jgi:hypothetical protein
MDGERGVGRWRQPVEKVLGGDVHIVKGLRTPLQNLFRPQIIMYK